MACSPAVRRRAARSWRVDLGSCGMRAAGVPRRAENGKTCRWVSPASSISASVRSNIASVSVGKPAIRSAPNAMSGRSPAKGAQADHVGAPVAALHALQDQVVARLDAEVQMRHQARLVGDQIDQIGVDLGRIDRGQAQARQLGHRAAAAGPAGRS